MKNTFLSFPVSRQSDKGCQIEQNLKNQNYSVEQWGLTEKYKSTKDFIKYTIESAKEELDRSSPWTFDYNPIYSLKADENRGRVGRKSITAITFFPKHVARYDSTTNVVNQISPSSVLGRAIIDRLVKSLGFSMAEIKANLVLFDTASKAFDLEGFLIQIGPKANRAANPQGYVINAIKIHLKEKHGIVFKKNAILAPEEELSKTKLKSAEVKPIKTPEQKKAEAEALMEKVAQYENKRGKSEPSTIGEILGLFGEEK